MTRGLQTRLVSFSGGRITTVALEPDYWDMIDEIKEWEKTTLNLIVEKIDKVRGKRSRANAPRIYVQNFYRFMVSSSGLGPRVRGGGQATVHCREERERLSKHIDGSRRQSSLGRCATAAVAQRPFLPGRVCKNRQILVLLMLAN
jgi:predicted DNA-binding ribbon-helix-helix protein